MRVFHRHQILSAHAFARTGSPAVCILDIAEPRARLFDIDYNRLMATTALTVGLKGMKQIVPRSNGDLQHVELTGAPCAHLIQLANDKETKPQREAAKLARQKVKRAAWEREQGAMMLGAT